MSDRQIARRFAEVYAKVWLLCYDIVKEQGGKIMTLQQILEEVKDGQLSVEHAENLLKKGGYEEMDYAKLDTTRKERTGFAEVVYCARKADEHLLNIYQKLYKEDGEVFGTRASQHQYELVKSVLPQVVYDPVSGILKIEKEKEHIGKVTVCTAGTADISVAEEAAQTESISELMWSGSMMWESAACTGCFPGWIRSRMQTVSLQWPEWREHLPV